MLFEVLGSVNLVRSDGVCVPLPARKPRVLLSLLLLHANDRVRVDRLVEALWDHDPPRSAAGNVKTYVSNLRNLLAGDAPGGIASAPITHGRGGYGIRVERDELDAFLFEDAVSRGRAAWHAGAAREAADVLSGALARWRGVPFEELAGADVEAVRTRLGDQRLAAHEHLAQALMALRRHDEAVSALREVVAEHPFREQPRGLLMIALHRMGRSAEALEVYEDTREVLDRELGLLPGAELRRIQAAVLSQDVGIGTGFGVDTGTSTSTGTGTVTGVETGIGTATGAAAGAGQPLPAPEPDGPTASPVIAQLPAAPRGFVGRERELDALTANLDTGARIGSTVVISAIGGAGGIGKTWLALHWAHRNADRFPDGHLFVNLRGFSSDGPPLDPATALHGFLSALDVDPRRIPADPHARSALFRSLVADKRMLIVLDNAADTAQVTPLLPGGDACTVVVTSRNRLPGLITGHGARHLALDILSDDEARALLATWLGAARIAAEPAAVDELVRLCGGFPLALSIIAGRVHAHPHLVLASIAAELRGSGLDALDDGDPAASLPTVLSWSQRALTGEQAEVFGLLALAPEPDIGLDAAVHLAGIPRARTKAVLRELEQASLISQHAPGRYRMHCLVRRYAAETAQDLAAEVREAARRRVVDFYLHTACRADRLLHRHRPPIPLDPPAPGVTPLPLPDDAAALAWFGAEHGCLLAAQHTAAAQGRHRVVWQLAWAMDSFHYRRGHLQDQLAAWRAGLTAAERLDDSDTRARAHRSLGRAYAALGWHTEAIEHLGEALAVAEEHRDDHARAHTHFALSNAWQHRGDGHKALDHATRALAVYRTLGNPVWEARALNVAGWCAARLGRYDTARAQCEAALALHGRDHDPDGRSAILDSLGYIAHHTGRHEDAVDHYRHALALRRDLGDTFMAAEVLEGMGHPLAALDRVTQARATWTEAMELFRTQQRSQDADRVRRLLDALDATAARTPVRSAINGTRARLR